MDYQTFNSPQPSFGGFSSAPTPPTTTQPSQAHSPSPQLYGNADPQARLHHQQQIPNQPPNFNYQQPHFANGQGYPNTSAAGTPSLTSAQALQQQQQLHHAQAQAQARAHHPMQHHQQQQQQQQQHSPSPYSSAPFAQPLASPAHLPQHHQQFAQRQTASPSSVSSNNNIINSNSNNNNNNNNNHHPNNPNNINNTAAPPYATPNAQHRQSPSVPSSTQPMNPPTGQSAMSQPMSVHTPVKTVPQSPVSPGSQVREKQRIDTLLEINQLLIQEVVELHSQGKAGHIGPTPDVKPEGEKQQQISPEYRDCMRRLQVNLSYLAQNAERHAKPNQPLMPGPAIMTSPTSPDELVKLYTKLQSLFPGWKGGTTGKASPGPQRLNSTSSQSGAVPNFNSAMQPPNSAGLHNNMQPPNSAGLPPNMQLPSNANTPNTMQQ